MKYAIIPANGHAGTHGTVYRSHFDKTTVVAAARAMNKTGVHKVQVVECGLPKGSSITMRFVGNLYPCISL